ncbi:MAG: tetratricopeptide repeat protein, partial [Muribaculaceae bacterium]|nr:tetratricopeptide repeat protein [Muribaculaceae bacterium]
VYSKQGNYQLALEYLQKALSIRLDVFGENHPNVATSYNNIGYVYLSLGEYQQALEYYQKALKISLAVLNENHPNIGLIYKSIGETYFILQDFSQALQFFEKALQILPSSLGEGHPTIPTLYLYLGMLYYISNSHSKAIEFLEKSVKIWTENYDEKHPYILDTLPYIYSSYLTLLQTDSSLIEQYKRFMSDKAWTATVTGEDTPAAHAGLSGEYVILRFGDWWPGSLKSLLDMNEELTGKPKDIVLYRDGQILRHHFEDQIGMEFSLKIVGRERKKEIEEALSRL